MFHRFKNKRGVEPTGALVPVREFTDEQFEQVKERIQRATETRQEESCTCRDISTAAKQLNRTTDALELTTGTLTGALKALMTELESMVRDFADVKKDIERVERESRDEISALIQQAEATPRAPAGRLPLRPETPIETSAPMTLETRQALGRTNDQGIVRRTERAIMQREKRTTIEPKETTNLENGWVNEMLPQAHVSTPGPRTIKKNETEQGPDGWLTLNAALTAHGISRSYLYKKAQEGKIGRMKTGGKTFFAPPANNE